MSSRICTAYAVSSAVPAQRPQDPSAPLGPQHPRTARRTAARRSGPAELVQRERAARRRVVRGGVPAVRPAAVRPLLLAQPAPTACSIDRPRSGGAGRRGGTVATYCPNASSTCAFDADRDALLPRPGAEVGRRSRTPTAGPAGCGTPSSASAYSATDGGVGVGGQPRAGGRARRAERAAAGSRPARAATSNGIPARTSQLSTQPRSNTVIGSPTGTGPPCRRRDRLQVPPRGRAPGRGAPVAEPGGGGRRGRADRAGRLRADRREAARGRRPPISSACSSFCGGRAPRLRAAAEDQRERVRPCPAGSGSRRPAATGRPGGGRRAGREVLVDRARPGTGTISSIAGMSGQVGAGERAGGRRSPAAKTGRARAARAAGRDAVRARWPCRPRGRRPTGAPRPRSASGPARTRGSGAPQPPSARWVRGGDPPFVAGQPGRERDQPPGLVDRGRHLPPGQGDELFTSSAALAAVSLVEVELSWADLAADVPGSSLRGSAPLQCTIGVPPCAGSRSRGSRCGRSPSCGTRG